LVVITNRALKDTDVDAFVEDVLVNGKPWTSGIQEELSGSFVFVCAHGSRDKRCGVCGPALIEKFEQEIGSRGLSDQIFVKPCSHIGGHKYAGNLIVFSPDSAGNVNGHWYGYVTPDDVPAMLDQHIAKGEIIQNLSRGQMRLRPEGEEAEKEDEHKVPDGNSAVERESVEMKGFTGGCCQGAKGVSCCQEQTPEPAKKETSVKQNWFKWLEKEEVLLVLGAAAVGAIATIAVAYSIYRRSGSSSPKPSNPSGISLLFDNLPVLLVLVASLTEGQMFATRNLLRTCRRSLSSLLHSDSSRNLVVSSNHVTSNLILQPGSSSEGNSNSFQPLTHQVFKGWSRAMSTARGRSMRSKVESRMRKESGKTLREIRRAKKLKKKLMTDEERLIYNLKRAKKKVALLLQKLKKYDLPELPSPVHDPELFTPEQIQAFKKIGFKNKNYVPVGVRGVFGGVVQNMHMHWKFHETVQVCCDNFPKEKIKEMATMIASLSGGVVINIHNVKTIIMFRGRNYRQPKNLIPVNTLTKRKALFKARFEQALESQKLNIKKTEQQLRRMGVNPEDPVAMASIQRVASTFFNAIDKKEGSPYVFHGDKKSERGASVVNTEGSEPGDEEDSDQEELDRFIAEIEEAADKEWEEEEAAEQEETGRIRYWNREEFAGRSRDSSQGFRRNERDTRSQRRSNHSDEDDDSDQLDSGDDDEIPRRFDRPRSDTRRQGNDFMRRSSDPRSRVRSDEDVLSDLDNTMWDSEDEEDAPANYISSSDEEEDENRGVSASKQPRFSNNNSSREGTTINNSKTKSGKQKDEDWDSD
ncbi:unnamed protein product, partial [Brassica oleracea]